MLENRNTSKFAVGINKSQLYCHKIMLFSCIYSRKLISVCSYFAYKSLSLPFQQ